MYIYICPIVSYCTLFKASDFVRGKRSTRAPKPFELHNKRKYRKIRDMLLENNVEENQLMRTFSVSVCVTFDMVLPLA